MPKVKNIFQCPICGASTKVLRTRSALARQKNAQGRSGYDPETLTMAAFRDSSEIEFGVDDAYILVAGEEPSERVLKHLKSRNGECRDIALQFDGSIQRFSGTADVAEVGSWWSK